MTTAEPKPTRGLMSKPLANQTASSRTGQSAPLHPSWAAKQMQKQALLTAAPAGRKKVFSDNGQTVTEALSAAVPVKQPTSADAKSEPGGRARGSSTAEALHPSWAAKRAASAQKVDLTSAPKARKIVFDQ